MKIRTEKYKKIRTEKYKWLKICLSILSVLLLFILFIQMYNIWIVVDEINKLKDQLNKLSEFVQSNTSEIEASMDILYFNLVKEIFCLFAIFFGAIISSGLANYIDDSENSTKN